MRPRATRHNTRSSIVLTTRGMGRYFTVTNVSKSGAALKGEKHLNVGEGVTLNYSGGRINATVKWAKQDQAGVAFEHELGRDALENLIDPAYIAPQHPHGHSLN
ncbi:MAG: PilZ domain-containing protein [Octadecabacter sp.]